MKLALVLFLASLSLCGKSIPIPDPGPKPVCQNPPGKECSADTSLPCTDCFICDATTNFTWRERAGCPPVTCETVGCPEGYSCDEIPAWPYRECRPKAPPPPPPTPTPEPPAPPPPPAPEPVPPPEPPAGPTCGPPPPGVVLCNTDDNAPSCGCWKCGPKSDWKWAQKAPCPPIPSGPDPCATCWRCVDLLTYQVRRGHLTPVQVTQGPNIAEIIYTDGNNTGKNVNKKCETVDNEGRVLGPPSWFLGGACWPESKWLPQCEGGPAPAPTPTPDPQPSPPEPAPSPGPLPAACPWPDGSSLSWVGIVSRGRVPAKTQGGEYLGWRYNFDATPHSKGAAFCAFHRPDQQQCDQLEACQDPRGPDFYMTLPGRWTNERCDKNSGNAYQCHHKPKADEVGPTTVCAVPAGDSPNSPRGRCVTVQVGP